MFWFFGITFEIIADNQKTEFPENKDKFIQSGGFWR